MSKVIIPENYHSCLSSYETQEAIGVIKHLMEAEAKEGNSSFIC